MRNTIFLLVVVFLLSGCGKKKEEVIVSKNEEPVVQKEEPRNEDAPVKKETINENLTAGSNSPKQNRTEEYIKLKSSETSGKIGQNAIVTGFVAEVNVREKVAYLNFDKRYPDNIFTAVVFPDKYELFGDLNKFKGKNVEVRGRIGQYRGKPQIILNGKEQIKIISN